MFYEFDESDIIKEAREWIGTPYVHMQSAKGHGCDCVGLVLGVWEKLAGPAPMPKPVYTPQWPLHNDTSQLEDLLENHYKLPRAKTIKAGTILCFGFRNRPTHHVGIYTEEETFIHSYMNRNEVQETKLEGAWLPRMTCAFEYPLRSLTWPN